MAYYTTYPNGSIYFNGGGQGTDDLSEKITIDQTNVSTVMSGTLVSDRPYKINGVVDLTGLNINFSVPSTGVSIIGANFDVSQIICSDDNYTLFESLASGNILIDNVGIQIDGTGSKVFDLVSNTGNEAIEINKVNFNSCTSLGVLDNFRQYLENGTGRFGGTPELEFKNQMNGCLIDTSIVIGISNISSLFKAGSGLSFSSRFITNLNCDLPATGNLIDFSDSNFENDESLILRDTFITREGAVNTTDANISPNINERNVKCLWSNNTGITNTQKYIKQNITTEVTTTISVIDTYYPLAGTWTVEANPAHFDSPSNGELRLLSGNGKYQIFGNLAIDGTANDVIDIRATMSTDNGSTWPTVIDHVKRQINSFAGSRDVAFFEINFLASIKKNSRVRLEVENKTGTGNVTAELDGTLIITSV